MRTSSFAQLMERMRTERLRQSARVAGGGLGATQPETPRERVEGLLLGATSSARGQQK
jgi:hypothetical protein